MCTFSNRLQKKIATQGQKVIKEPKKPTKIVIGSKK